MLPPRHMPDDHRGDLWPRHKGRVRVAHASRMRRQRRKQRKARLREKRPGEQ